MKVKNAISNQIIRKKSSWNILQELIHLATHSPSSAVRLITHSSSHTTFLPDALKSVSAQEFIPAPATCPPGLWPRKFHGQRSLEGYSTRGHKTVRYDLVTKQQSFPLHFEVRVLWHIGSFHHILNGLICIWCKWNLRTAHGLVCTSAESRK